MKQVPVITIDGPSGTGKGTISQLLAERLGWHFLDSGALYRIVALAAEKQAVALDDADALSRIAGAMEVVFGTGVQQGAIWLDGEEVAEQVRLESTGEKASKVAVIPALRAALLARQKAFCKPPGLVADGRDMGTVVFPEAQCKIFLTASSEERAQRRYKQLKNKGVSVTLSGLLRDIEQRDERDAQREVSPLRPAVDAKVIDTTTLSIEQVLEAVLLEVGKSLPTLF